MNDRSLHPPESRSPRPLSEARALLSCPPEVFSLTHAITVSQPLAWAAAAGYCPVLMSDTRPPMEREGQLIGIHASQHWISGAEMTALEPALGRKVTGADAMAAQSRGALVGVARLVGVIRADRYQPSRLFHRVKGHSSLIAETLSDERCQEIAPWWRSGSKWGLLLTDAVLLPEPILMRGAGGVWRIVSPEPDGSQGRRPEARDWALEQWRKARGA